MKITEDFIMELTDRLLWDGVWSDDTYTCHLDSNTISDVLTVAAITLGKDPSFYCVTWEIGKALINEKTEILMGDDNEKYDNHPFKLRRKFDKLRVMGLIGTFNGVPIIASGFNDLSFVTAAKRPNKVSYDAGAENGAVLIG